MLWKLIIILGAAVASYFVPTPLELQKEFVSGQNFYASGNFDKAIKQYDIIINTQSPLLDEDSVKVELLSGELVVGVVAAAYYQKANALKNLENKDGAIKIFRIVEARTDEPTLSALSQFQIYDIYYRLAKYDSAIIEAKKLVQKYPTDPKSENALYDIGWAYKELNDLEKSNEALKQLLEKYPESKYVPNTLYQIAENYFEMKDYDNAILFWNDLVTRFNPESFQQQDWENVQLKSVRERQIFEATAGRETDESILELVAKAQVKIGDAYKNKKAYYEAMNHYRKVVVTYSLLPVLVEVSYIKMAEYTLEEKGIDSAIVVYQSAIDENFANKELQAKMQYKIAETYQNNNLFEKAADAYGFYAAGYAEVADLISFPVENSLYFRIINLFNAELFEKTITEIDSFIVKYPASEYKIDLIYLSGNSYFSLKDYDNARMKFEEVIAEDSESSQAALASIYIGRLYYEQEKYSEASDVLRSFIEKGAYPKFNDEANYYLLQVYYDAGTYDSIPAVFNSINITSPYFVPSVIKTSKSFILNKKFDEGEKFITRLVAAADSVKDSVYFLPEAHYSLADLYINTKRNELAVPELTKIIDDPKSNELLKLQSLYLRGTLYSQQGNYTAAIKDIEEALNDPKFKERMELLVPNARGRLATAYVNAGQLQKGVDMMLNFINSAADSIEKARYTVALAEVYYDTKDFKKAISYGEKALTLAGDDEQLYTHAVYLIATSYNFTNESIKGINILNKASEKFPKASKELFFNYAVNLYDNDYLRDAIEAFTKFIDKYPDVPEKKNSMFFIGYAYYKLGDWEQSIESFRNYIKEYPEDEFAAESQFNIGEAYYNLSRFGDAAAEYRIVQTKYPKSDFAPAALYNEAWAYYQMKEIDKMIIPLQRLINEYPDNHLVPEAQFTIGDYYYNKKEYVKALIEYKNFIDRFPDHYKTEEAKSFIKELSQIDAFKEYQKAIVRFDKKDYNGAIADLQKVVDSYPDTEVAMACEANIASAYEQLGNKNKAVELYRSIISKYKDHPAGSGVVYFSQQHLEWLGYEAAE